MLIEMDAWLTDILRGRRLHPSQVVEEMPGGVQTPAPAPDLLNQRGRCARIGTVVAPDAPCQNGLRLERCTQMRAAIYRMLPGLFAALHMVAIGAEDRVVLESDHARYTISANGRNLGFVDRASGIDYLRKEVFSSCALVRLNGKDDAHVFPWNHSVWLLRARMVDAVDDEAVSLVGRATSC